MEHLAVDHDGVVVGAPGRRQHGVGRYQQALWKQRPNTCAIHAQGEDPARGWRAAIPAARNSPRASAESPRARCRLPPPFQTARATRRAPRRGEACRERDAHGVGRRRGWFRGRGVAEALNRDRTRRAEIARASPIGVSPACSSANRGGKPAVSGRSPRPWAGEPLRRIWPIRAECLRSRASPAAHDGNYVTGEPRDIGVDELGRANDSAVARC